MRLSEKKLQELKNGKLQFEDLTAKYFYTQKDGVNVENVLRVLNENIYSFEEIVDKFKSIQDYNDRSYLHELLANQRLFKELRKKKLLTEEDLRYLLNSFGTDHELLRLSQNTSLLSYIIDILSFKELVDKYKSVKDKNNDPCLSTLFWNEELFKEMIQNNVLNKEDLRYLLNEIDKFYELHCLCRSTLLIKYILNEFILDKETVDRFNARIEDDEYWRNRANIHTIFDRIEYENKNDEEVLKLNELNRKIYNFDLTKDQKLEIHEILKNNEQARNTLIQIVENHLQDQYDFEQLKSLLIKDDKKKKIKMNF